MQKLTLLEASKEVGLTKQAIVKAVKKGTISASKDAKGVYRIDASELFRVYEPSKQQPVKTTVETKPTNQQPIDLERERLLIELQVKLEATEKELYKTNVQLDKTERKLDDALSSKEELQERFNNLLEDRSKDNEKRGLLSRIFGGA